MFGAPAHAAFGSAPPIWHSGVRPMEPPHPFTPPRRFTHSGGAVAGSRGPIWPQHGTTAESAHGGEFIVEAILGRARGARAERGAEGCRDHSRTPTRSLGDSLAR